MKSRLIYILPVLVLAACSRSDKVGAPTSDVELQQRLVGRWRADSRLPRGIHVQSETVVDAGGSYTLHLTNTLVDGVRTATLAGTLRVRDGLLVDTITNDFGGNTLVPRIASVDRIIRLDEQELIVRGTNSDETVSYRKDTR